MYLVSSVEFQLNKSLNSEKKRTKSMLLWDESPAPNVLDDLRNSTNKKVFLFIVVISVGFVNEREIKMCLPSCMCKFGKFGSSLAN